MSVILYESFPGKTGSGDVQFDEGWSATGGPGADYAIDPNCRVRFAPDAFGFGEECLRLLTRSGSGNAYIDISITSVTRAWACLDFAVGATTLPGLADGSYHTFFRERDSGTGNTWMVTLKRVGSALKLHLQYRNNNANVEASEEATVVGGGAYRLEVYYTGSGYSGTKQCIWKLNGTTIGTYTLTGTIRSNVGALRVGFIDSGSSGDDTTLYVYRVAMDDTNAIGARPVSDYAYQNIAWMDQVSVVETGAELPAYAFGLGHEAASQVAWTASLATQASQQTAYGCGFEQISASRTAFTAGVAGLAAASSAYLSGQGSSQAVTSQRAAWLRGFDRAQAGSFAYAAGIGAAAHAISAFLQGALGTSGQQGAYLGGSGSHLEAVLPAYSAAFAGLAVQSAAYVVCGLPPGRVGFQSGVEQIVFSCPRLYPLRQPRERLQVICRTAGGTVRVQDKGLGVRRLRLAFRGLSAEDYAALERWFEMVSVGALHPFTLINEAGGERLVRWTGGFDFEQTASGRFSGEIQLEEVTISEVNA